MHLSDAEPQGIGPGTILRRKEDGDHECVADEVAIEEPLEIRIGGKAIATTMRIKPSVKPILPPCFSSLFNTRNLQFCLERAPFGNGWDIGGNSRNSPRLCVATLSPDDPQGRLCVFPAIIQSFD